MKFDDAQQEDHRLSFWRECRQKAWGAACHAEWIGKELDIAMAQYKALQAEAEVNLEEQKTLKDALDSHTDENQAKRKTLRGRREEITTTIEDLTKNIRQGQQLMQQLYQSLETNISLAEHSKTWSWKQAEPVNPETPIA
jgi:chromosome segregation ATPase